MQCLSISLLVGASLEGTHTHTHKHRHIKKPPVSLLCLFIANNSGETLIDFNKTNT